MRNRTIDTSKKKSPCMGCPHRRLHCHAWCEDYREEKEGAGHYKRAKDKRPTEIRARACRTRRKEGHERAEMRGYKGFSKGLICRDKQYAENTVFEEDAAEICRKGMHFCENPFDVLDYYGFVNDKGELNEFAEVEALDKATTDDNKKYVTKKLRIGAKLDIPGLVKAFVDFTISKTKKEKSKDANMSAATNTGDMSAATNTGYRSAAVVEGKESFAIATGIESKAKGKLGCYIALAEWKRDDQGEWHVIDFKTHKVDGETIKEDVFYTLKDGEFVEV